MKVYLYYFSQQPLDIFQASLRIFINNITFHKIMRLLRKLKNFIEKSDLLCSRTLLRVNGEPQFQTTIGGLISITIMVLLAALFYNKVIDTLNKVLITSSTTTMNEQDPSGFLLKTIDEGVFMFGVEVWHHDLNTGKRYFDVTLTNTIYDYGQPSNRSVQYPLEPCRMDHWDGHPEIQSNFNTLFIKNWMCLPKNVSYEIKGKYASVQSKTLDVALKKCTNNTFNIRPCATDAQISQFFIDNNGPMFFTIYFINPLINPNSQNYLSYYLQDSNYIAFSATGGEESRIFVQDYTIETDESILPFNQIKTETGGVISNSPLKSTYTEFADTYAIYIFYKSPITLDFQRSFQKLDDVFSYIGGLFGTIMIVFFLVSAYNTYKFQINISGYLYVTDQKQQHLQSRYNFLYFLGQLIFGLLKRFSFSQSWERLKYYHKIREEALKQLDVLLLFKRLNFLEKSLSLLFTDCQLTGLHLANHTTLSEAITIRKNYQLKPRLKQQIQQMRRKSSDKSIEQRGQYDSNISYQIFKDKKANGDKPQEQGLKSDSFDSQDYSSDESSEEEGEEKVLESVIQLKSQCERNPTSKRIWVNLDNRLKNLIKSVASNETEEQDITAMKERFQQHKIANTNDQRNPNLFLFQEPNIQDFNDDGQIRNQNRYIFAQETFQKLRGNNNKTSIQIQPIQD